MRKFIVRLLATAGIVGALFVAGAGLASATDGMTHDSICRMTHN